MNPQETPQQVDLSKDVSSQGITLSLDQQKSFQEYLDTLKEEEKKGIILLTQSEIQGLKDTLNVGGNAHMGTRTERVASFIENQKQEGLSTSDILGGNELIDEKTLTELDQRSHDLLFGPTGTFAGLEISDIAQDNISVALSLSIIDVISKVDPFTANTITEMLNGTGENYTAIQNGLNAVQNITKNAAGPDDGLRGGNPVFIAGNGERNFLFMQTEKGKDFFNQIFSGTLQESDIKTFVEKQNIEESVELPQGIANTLSHIQESGVQNMKDIEGKVKTALENMTPQEAAAVVAAGETITGEANESSPEELTGLAKWLHDFFQSFIEAFKGLIPETKNTETGAASSPVTPTQNNETLSESEQSLKDALKNIPAVELTSINPRSLSTSLDDPEYFNQISSLLEGIDSEKTATQTLQDLFGNSHKFIGFSQALKTENIPELTDISNHSPAEIFKTILSEYSQYKNNPDVRGKENGRTTWAEYAQTRKQQNWSQRSGK